MLTVVAVDPGITSGIAKGIVDEGLMDFAADEADLKCLGLWTRLNDWQPDILVYESFQFRQGKQRSGIELFSRNLIGVMQLYSEMTGIDLVEQSPGQVMDYFTNTRLKEESCYLKGKEHARDAIRHIMSWFYFGAGYKYNEKGHRFDAMPFL